MKIKFSTLFLFAFIACLTILPRMYKIDTPLADWHSWRQADTVSVTRYLIDSDFDILHPRYHDISRIQTGYENPEGYRFVEFPIFNLINALIFIITPLSLEVSARIVSIFAAVVTSWTLFLIGKKMASFWSGFWSAVIYAILPFSVFFTRVALPDPLSTSLGLLGAYLFWEYIDREKKLFLFASALSFSVGLLVKPFALFFGIPVALLVVGKWGVQKSFVNGILVAVALLLPTYLILRAYVGPVDVQLAILITILVILTTTIIFSKKVIEHIPEFIALLIVIAPLALWRAWINQPELLVGIPSSEWLLNGDEIRFRPSFWFWIFGERIGKLITGYWGLALVGAGLFSNKSKNFLIYIAIAAFTYLSVFATANVKHDYYQTFIIPAVALAMGHGMYSIYSKRYLNKIYASILIAFCMAMTILLSFFWIREFYKINDTAMLSAASRMKEISKEDDLIIAPYNGNSVFLYHTGRRGWPVVTTNIDQMIDWGAKYYVSTSKGDTDSVNFKNRFELVEETDEYIILKLTSEN